MKNTGRSIITTWMTIALLTLVIPGFSNRVFAQYTLNNASSSIQLSGTSSLHDWEADVEQMSGSLKVTLVADQIDKITALIISLSVNSIKSEKSKLTRNLHEALKSDDFPTISYVLKKYTIDKSEISLTGDITIAGVTKSIKTKVTWQLVDDEIRISGNLHLKMTDFDVKPPEFMLGTMKTGDKVSLKLYFVFTQSTNK